MDDIKQEIVEECLELLRQGETLEQCLERHPEEAADLEPILRVALSVRSDLAAVLPLPTRTRMRGRVLAEWDRQHQPRRWNLRIPSIFSKRALLPEWALFPRLAFATAILVVALALGGLGTNTAAANSVPGDMLYPVKEMREGVQLWFARSPEAKVEMYTSFVNERVEEVSKMAAREQANLDAISDALARMQEHLTALNVVVDGKLALSNVERIDSDFVEALQKSIAEQGAAGNLLETALEEVPTEGRPAFSNALNALQTAQERVDSALETVGQSGFND
ncbi:MAG: hypothetical protein BZY87_04580 [SAR202 cluster bacterium Io17-Chloro-G6]|nr:MAG: hypothetical protein BZY87_04580 [SAR202 cluster bacterium Io17-Chloro-G6]